MTKEAINNPEPTPRGGWRKRRTSWIIGTALLVGAVALLIRQEQQAELSFVGRGKELATKNGCFACHGTTEGDQRANFRRLGSGTWKPKAIPTFWENGIDRADELNEWITKGVTAKEAENHKRLFIRMPAYGGFLKPLEIESISAWILAEAVRLSQGSEPMAKATADLSAEQIAQLSPDRLLVMGDHLSRRHGCYQCHGELGQGGVANPSSFKGYIPGFFGSDFRQLTNSGERRDILEWIDQGRGHAIVGGPLGFLAKRFLDAQAIGMPGYRDQLTETEKNLLTEYMLLLNKEGPLTAKRLEGLLKLLNDEPSNKS